MYHSTPKQAESEWDVPLDVFRDQIRSLIDAGVRFIPFRDALDERYYGDETFVSVTFDDGHESNLDAFDVLASVGVEPTAFIIADWSRHGRSGYLSSQAISTAADRCAFGSHGASHTGLSDLAPGDLRDELIRSRAYLEELLQVRVTTISAPGGRLNRQVVAEAEACGFDVIGSSVELANGRPRNPLHRVAIRQVHDASHPARLATASRSYWLKRSVRRRAVGVATRILGEQGTEILRGRLGRR